MKRQFQRYQILDLPDLRVGIGTYSASTKLITFGEGGCAFVSNSGRLLHPPLRLEISIEWRGEIAAFSIGGHLLYAFLNTKEHGDAAYYGIEFDQEDRFLIQPIVEKIERLHRDKSPRVILDFPA